MIIPNAELDALLCHVFEILAEIPINEILKGTIMPKFLSNIAEKVFRQQIKTKTYNCLMLFVLVENVKDVPSIVSVGLATEVA